ncbi:MAG: hypothetical protein PWQ54_1916 [Bacteroidales bacterium]|nr:hypothetical protein [Bacteroidales bacterium]
MNRCLFLKSLTAASATLLLPFSLSGLIATTNKTNILAIGDLASTIVTNNLSKIPLPKANIRLLCNPNFVELPDDSGIQQSELEQLHPEELFHHNEHYLILSDLTYSESAALAIKAGNYLSQHKIKNSFMTILPFRYQGITTRQTAVAALNTLTQQTSCQPFDLEHLRTHHGEQLFTEAFSQLEQQILQQILMQLPF